MPALLHCCNALDLKPKASWLLVSNLQGTDTNFEQEPSQDQCDLTVVDRDEYAVSFSKHTGVSKVTTRVMSGAVVVMSGHQGA
jgi:hypothetical protein